jgi:hypothetical protein
MLGKRDRCILGDVTRYRLVTNEWVLARYVPGAKPNAAVKITGRLVRDGWLSSHRLYRRRNYFTAGQRLVRYRGLSPERLRPLGPQALASHYSLLRYCMAAEVSDSPAALPRLLTRQEVMTSLPWLPLTLVHRSHILLGPEANPNWRMVRVDLGGRPDHLARKVARDLTQLFECSEAPPEVAQGGFTQVVLCSSSGKKRLIEQALAARPWPKGTRFQLGIVPELVQLVGCQ